MTISVVFEQVLFTMFEQLFIESYLNEDVSCV